MPLTHLSLTRRFALAMLACALVPLAVFTLVNYARTSAALVRVQDHVVAATTATVESGFAQVQDEGIAPYVVTEDFRDEVSAGDRGALAGAAATILQSRNLVQVEVRGPGGSTLARTSILARPLALRTGAGGFAFQQSFGRPLLVSAVPVTSNGPGGRRLGTVVAAGQLSDSMLASVAQRTLTPVSVYVGGRLAASSLQGAGRPERLAAAQRGVGAGSRTDYFSSLRDARGREIGTLAVAVPVSAFSDIRGSTRTASELALALAMAAAIVAALLLSRRIAAPLRRLSTAAEAMSRGQLRQTLPVEGRDEVAVMATAFNDMSERVADTVDELAGQIQALSRALADLSLVGETLAQTRDVTAELSAVSESVRKMMTSDFCGVHLLDEARQTEAVYAGSVNGSMLAVEELVRCAGATAETVTTAELSRDPRVSALAAQAATGITCVLVVPVVHRGHAAGAISIGSVGVCDYSPSTVALLSTVASQVATALRHAQTFQELEGSYRQTVVALASALEAKDVYTANHADAIAELAVAVGREMGLTDSQLRRLEYTALLHDVGKIAIAPDILDKPGPLTSGERGVVDRHTVVGEGIVARIDYLRPLAPLVRAAHERWDGRGYPDGLAGEEIPQESRITFACDAWHAMTSDRPYRKRLSADDALSELRREAGSQFDPAVVAALVKVVEAGAGQLSNREEPTAPPGVARVGGS